MTVTIGDQEPVRDLRCAALVHPADTERRRYDLDSRQRGHSVQPFAGQQPAGHARKLHRNERVMRHQGRRRPSPCACAVGAGQARRLRCGASWSRCWFPTGRIALPHNHRRRYVDDAITDAAQAICQAVRAGAWTPRQSAAPAPAQPWLLAAGPGRSGPCLATRRPWKRRHRDRHLPRHHRARRAQPPGTRHCPWCGTMRRSLRLQPDTVARASEQVAGTRLPRGSAGRVDVR